MRISPTAATALCVVVAGSCCSGLCRGFAPSTPSFRRAFASEVERSLRRGKVDVARTATDDDDDAGVVANGENAVDVDVETSSPPAVLSAGHEIASSNDGPGDSAVHTLTVRLGAADHPEPLVLETGRVGRQASAAVTLRVGDTVLYATACRDDAPREGLDFLPLSVEHKERFSSIGSTSGSYNKRDGRAAEHEILTCRLIDRPLRPVVADGWRHETQLLSWVLSYDGVRSPDPLAVTAAAAALWLSDVPMARPVAGVEVGLRKDTGTLIVNPTMEEMEASPLRLTVAGTKDAILMIEGAADFLPEDKMMEAVRFGHAHVRTICEALEDFAEVAGKEKRTDTLPGPIPNLEERVDELFMDRVDELLSPPSSSVDKASRSAATSVLSKAVVAETEDEFGPDNKNAVMAAFKDLLSRRLYARAVDAGLRADGRALDEVRRVDVDAGFLPRVHGSALFTRGETQTIATATLGDSKQARRIDTLEGVLEKRFYLQYLFPPSCVGETGRVGMPGRREVGHGDLAERALAPSLPSDEDFPYVVRLESLVTESHGSSSMASVCGGSLALMDAGVPVSAPVAGIAMGLLKSDVDGEPDVVLSDITGTEDALGTMDFKVAGDRHGITAFQLDIKCEGLDLDTMSDALEQARRGRLTILDAMDAGLSGPRDDLPDTVPRIVTFKIDADGIGKVIGPGGKQIRAIIEDFDLANMNVDEDGTIQISGHNATRMDEARAFTEGLLVGGGGGRGGGRGGGGRGGGREPRPEYAGPPPEVGAVYTGRITGVHAFGVFVEILPGAEDGSTPGLEGLCHVSELHVERVRNCEAFVGSMNTEELTVKVLGVNDKGKLQLSRKAVLEDNRAANHKGKSGGGGGGSGGGRRTPATPKKTKTEVDMSPEEVDVIAQAIEGITEL